MSNWKLSAAAMALLLIVGCSQQNNTSTAASQPAISDASAASEAVVEKHNYVVKDGLEYGYESELSQNDKDQGKVANTVLMFRFAGEKDGRYQVYIKQGDLSEVAECEKPCDYIKIMRFSGNVMIDKEMVSGRNQSIGRMALDDAINGYMEQFVGTPTRGGTKPYHVWFTEQGRILEPVTK